MKRWIIFLLAFPLFTVLRAANRQLSSYEYWIDRNYDNRRSVSLSSSEAHIRFSIDTRDLVGGMHEVSLRVQDSEGRWGELVSTYFFVMKLTEEYGELAECEYWTDGDRTTLKTIAVSGENVAFPVNISQLNDGVHTVALRVKNSEGHYSGIVSSFFCKISVEQRGDEEVTECEYWTDGDRTTVKTVAVSGENVAFPVNISQLNDGVHTVALRMKNAAGRYSSIVSSSFCKISVEQRGDEEVTECEYWTDGDRTTVKTVAVSGEDVAFPIDFSNLSNGAHTVALRMKNAAGRYSGIVSSTFYKFDVEQQGGTPDVCEYWFDQDFAGRQQVAVNDGTVAFTVDASSQADGMHTLSWRVRDDVGHYSGISSSTYYKYTPVTTAEDIVWYQYWWNDRSDLAVRREVNNHGALTLEEIFEVPDYVAEAKDMETGTAEFHILFCNDKGNLSSITTEVVADRIPPVSCMNALPETQETNMQMLSWGGTDQWAGVKDYTVYVYDEENSQWKVYEENTPETSLPYICSRYDYTVKFFVLARDSLDNVEPMKTEAEAQVRFMYVDVYPPQTTLEVSSESVNAGESAELNWISADDVHEVKKNNIYYSEDGGPLILWKTVTNATSATFKGRAGTTYRFIVTGQDTEGNQEAPDMSKAVMVRFNK